MGGSCGEDAGHLRKSLEFERVSGRIADEERRLLSRLPLETDHRALDPVDEPEDEQDRDGVVEAALALERTGEPSLQRGAPEQSEDRRSVRRGDDRA
jgi:hypothetical protein